MRNVYTETLILHEASAGSKSREEEASTPEEKEAEEEERKRQEAKSTEELGDDPRLQLEKTWTKYFMVCIAHVDLPYRKGRGWIQR